MFVRAISYMHRYLYFAAVLVSFVCWWPFLAYWARDPERYYTQIARTRRTIGRWSSRMVGFRYRITFETPIDWSIPHIICPNHTSNLDITAMVLACPPSFSFVGKKELLNNPVTRLFFKTIDLPLDRSSRRSALTVYKKAVSYLERGRSVLIFPEGKIGDDYPPQLCPFKTGPFRMAIETGASIIPVTIHDAWRCFWDDGKTHGSRPGTIHVAFMAPLSGEDWKAADCEAFKDLVESQIRTRLEPTAVTTLAPETLKGKSRWYRTHSSKLET